MILNTGKMSKVQLRQWKANLPPAVAYLMTIFIGACNKLNAPPEIASAAVEQLVVLFKNFKAVEELQEEDRKRIIVPPPGLKV